MTLRDELLRLSEGDYRKFTSSLLPGVGNILGIRLPALRRLAREIARGDWRGYLATAEDLYFEERMIRGMVIGYARCDAEEKLRHVAQFVPTIDNWSVCDSFSTMRLRTSEREAVWQFIQPYFGAAGEFEVRYAVVTALAHFVDKEHLEELLKRLGEVRHEGYYARMAVAWAVSVCFVKFPVRTRAWLDACPLDEWTFRRSLQKIRESLRVSAEAKEELRALRRR